MKIAPSILTAAVFAALAASGLHAQTLILQDGRKIHAAKMRRSGDSILVPVETGAGSGALGYPLASIVKAEFPEPPELAAAKELIAQGKVDEALAQLDPALEFFSPIAGVPGSWWPRIALLQAQALEKTGKEKESAALLEQVARISKDPAAADIARLRLTRPLIAQGKYAEAQAICDAALAKVPLDRAIAAEAWLRLGDAHLAQRQFEPALDAYLHIPALYARQAAALPPSLLGSARAYLGMRDKRRAADAFTEITHDFPGTAEAKTAAEELQRLAKTETEQNP